MSESERKRKQRRFDEIKHTLRKIEGIIEVTALTAIYYFLLYFAYDVPTMHNFSGNGKWLLMGIYAFLTLILFLYCDSFKFGHLKLTDIVISQ